MKNKLYRISHRPGQNVELAICDLNVSKSINKKWLKNREFTTTEDRIKFEEGFKFGINNIDNIEEEKMNNIFFKRGYELGIRKYKVKEEKKIYEKIKKYVENDTKLDDCPSEIKENQIYRSKYLLETLKQRKLKK